MKMHRLLLVGALMALLTGGGLLAGCVRVDVAEKNGPLTTRSYEYTGFTGIEMGNAFNLDVTQGASYNVTITAGENVFSHIKVSQSGTTLKIDFDTWTYIWHSTPQVTITMPTLTRLDLSGASHSNISGFKSAADVKVKLSGASGAELDMDTGYFTAEVSGASTLKGRVAASGSDFDISGASNVDITGSGGNLKCHASGASSVSLFYYEANDADIEFTGASHGAINVSGRLDVDLSGASSLDYQGSPTLGNIDISGASDLNKK